MNLKNQHQDFDFLFFLTVSRCPQYFLILSEHFQLVMKEKDLKKKGGGAPEFWCLGTRTLVPQMLLTVIKIIISLIIVVITAFMLTLHQFPLDWNELSLYGMGMSYSRSTNIMRQRWQYLERVKVIWNNPLCDDTNIGHKGRPSVNRIGTKAIVAITSIR